MLIIHSAALTAARSSIWHAQRRHLFRLPDLSSFPSPFADLASIKPQTYHEQKVLPYVRSTGTPLSHVGELKYSFRYTRRQLYAVVSDVGSYASFIPFCTRSRVLRPLAPAPVDPNNTLTSQAGALQMEAELTVAFLAFTERYTSRVTCVPYESVQVRQSQTLRHFLLFMNSIVFRCAGGCSVVNTAVQDA